MEGRLWTPAHVEELVPKSCKDGGPCIQQERTPEPDMRLAGETAASGLPADPAKRRHLI